MATAAGKEFDELYHYDQIHRLKTMDRGTLNGTHTGLNSTAFGQCWTLDETGNWRGFREDDTGDGTWDLVQSRTANPVNEITDITESSGPSWFAPGYNRAGNMTTMPQPLALTSSYSATHDVWNRLVKLAAGADTVSEYSYDGAKRLIIQKSYAAGVLSETRHYYLTAGWQTIEERLGASPDSADPQRQFVWGLRYIDDCVLRDRDSDHNGTLDERLYALLDANWNVTGFIDPTGSVEERMAYTAYGVPLFLTSAFVPTTDSYDWENLYCGYRYEPASGLLHVRHRVLHPQLGNWIQRDQLAYTDGHSLYYLRLAVSATDPFGLQIQVPPYFRPDPTQRPIPPQPIDIPGRRPYVQPPYTPFKGSTCQIRVRCYTVTIPGIHIPTPGSHCGLIITTDEGEWSIDGTGGNENNWDWQKPPYDPAGNPAGTQLTPNNFPASTCECLRMSSHSWNKKKIPRNTNKKNSNWSLGCLADQCKISLTWGKFGKPYQFDAECCENGKKVRCPCPAI